MGTTQFRKPALADLPPFQASMPETTAPPDIALRHEPKAIVGAAIFSGALSMVAACQLNNPAVSYVGPGLLFGLLVLVPWYRSCGISWPQTLAAGGLAPCGYAVAVHLACSGSAGLLASGAVVCALMFAPLVVRCHPRVRAALIGAFFVGAMFGMVLAALPILALLGGIAAWQIAVAYCLSAALWVEER